MLDSGLPFELISPPPGQLTGGVRKGSPKVPGPTFLTRITARLPRPLAIPIGLITNPINKWILHPARSWIYSLRYHLHSYREANRETMELLPDADVYWLHSYKQYRAVRSKAKKNDARLLYDTPDAYWEPGQAVTEHGVERIALRTFEQIEKTAARRAERFTTCGDGIARLLEKRFGRRPDVVRNAHELRLDTGVERDVRQVAGVGPEDFLLVLAGQWKPGTAVREGLEAMQRLPAQVHLAFVGNDHEARSRGLVDEMGLADRVHLLQPVAPTEVNSFIRTADATLLLYPAYNPNYLYGLPNGFFHAVAAGLPVLYPPLPEIAALATEHDLGIEFDPTDPASIDRSVRALLDDPEARGRYRANAEKARQVINWEHEERTLAEILGPGA